MTIKKRRFEKRLAIMLLALKAELISILVIVEQVLPCKFPIHVYHCAMKNKCLKEPHFQLNIMMKLKDSRQLEFYENHFHKRGHDTINCPEHLKKHLNTLS